MQAPASTAILTDIGYRLRVVAPDAYSAAYFVGGWIFDQVRAGWVVTVYLPESDDDRPLRVLGADTSSLKELPGASAVAAPAHSFLAVSADLYESDDDVRSIVDRELNEHSHGPTFWGNHAPQAHSKHMGTLEHRLSVAASAFKSQALFAATTNPQLRHTETLYSISSHLSLRDRGAGAETPTARRHAK